MAGAGIIQVPNESSNQSSRKTKSGRTITYKLTVLQHPERARACGSGAKSSTDRRPVDPPPIVELKVYEGENETDLKDITFSYDATFFLYISLEQARVIAQGRGQTESKQGPALNCAGQPVSSCTYLERPNPAGYFLFSDISVRHEGQYRLSFNLFERVNEPQDEDMVRDVSQTQTTGESAAHRLDVRSKPFTVFSAKKFPGLAESTELSRVIAEQGCRVRIRRDVRMRKRNEKAAGKDWEHYPDENNSARRRMSATPEAAGYTTQQYIEAAARPPSSNGQSRRSSLHETNPPLQPSYGVAPQLQHPNGYINGPATHPAFTQQHSYPPAMQPPPPVYQSGHPQAVSPAPAPPPASYAYGPPPPIPTVQPHGAAPATFEGTYPHRPSMDHTSPIVGAPRRPSTNYVHSPQTYSSPSTVTYPPPYPTPHAHHSSFGSMDGYNRLAPAEPIQPPTCPTGVTTGLPTRPSFEDKRLPLPPLLVNTAYPGANTRPLEPSSPATAPVPQQQQQPGSYFPTPASAPSLDSHKRSYGETFNERHLAGPMRQGARPTPSMYTNSNASSFGTYTAVDDDPAAEAAPEPIRMVYRRADGRHVNRNLPAQA